MKKYILAAVALLAVGLMLTGDLMARGGRGGGGGGGARRRRTEVDGRRRWRWWRISRRWRRRCPTIGWPYAFDVASVDDLVPDGRPSGGGQSRPPSRPSMGNLPTPGSRPGGGGRAPSISGGTRPNTGSRPNINVGPRPGTGTRPNTGGIAGGARPGGGSRPNYSGRPTAGQLDHFLDIGGPGGGIVGAVRCCDRRWRCSRRRCRGRISA